MKGKVGATISHFVLGKRAEDFNKTGQSVQASPTARSKRILRINQIIYAELAISRNCYSEYSTLARFILETDHPSRRIIRLVYIREGL